MFASHTGPLLNATRLTMRLASCRVGTYARHEFQLIPEPMPVQFRAIKKIPITGIYFGGLGRNRTGIQGFAVLCITTLPPGLNCVPHSKQFLFVFQHKNFYTVIIVK